MGNIFNISNLIIYVMTPHCQTRRKSEHSSSCRTDILAVVIGTPINIAKIHLFVGRGSRAVAVIVIDAAY